ncbi:MurR/RpiR family transcriptional regulator [Arthrobacter zhaoguopingii]|nr:MurR/RpiR family transcriptional regulator [Arthrobacter zhaoguopingii]
MSRAVLARIRALLPSLRPSEQAVAAVVLADPERASSLSIGNLADVCVTSTASVVRFYRKVGYARYQDFRLDLAREATRERTVNDVPDGVYEDISKTDTLHDVVAKIAAAEAMSIADTAELLNVDRLSQAVGAVRKARRIDISSVGAGAWVGQDLQQKLHRIGLVAHSWSDAHSSWTSAALLSSDCVAIAISHSGETMDTVEALRIAHDAGATTIAITNHGDSSLGKHADITLTTAARETPFRSGAMGSRIAQMMVVDCLFMGVAQKAYDQAVDALGKTYAAVHPRRT